MEFFDKVMKHFAVKRISVIFVMTIIKMRKKHKYIALVHGKVFPATKEIANLQKVSICDPVI